MDSMWVELQVWKQNIHVILDNTNQHLCITEVKKKIRKCKILKKKLLVCVGF